MFFSYQSCQLITSTPDSILMDFPLAVVQDPWINCGFQHIADLHIISLIMIAIGLPTITYPTKLSVER
jgi:hypothetical protein